MAVFARFKNGDCCTSAACTARSADAMHVGFIGRWDTEIDDVRQVFQIDAASGNVGGDNRINLAGSGITHNAVTSGLIKAAVQCLDAVAANAKCFSQLIDFVAGAGEDDGKLGILKIKNASKRCRAVIASHDISDLRNTGGFAFGCFFLGNSDSHGVLQMFVSDLRNSRRERSGEECCLYALGEGLEDGIQFVGKAEVKHLVSFVENHGLYGIKLERAAINVIKGSTWRGNNDMRAALKRADLSAIFLSAVDRRHDDAGISAVAVKRFTHLQA